MNSILLAVGEGSAAHVSGSSLSATSEGSNGIFSTDGATVLARDVGISTTQGNSRGLDATYGGTIVAGEVDIATQGDHSAALATDRGGGNISVNGGDLATGGSGSPLVYSTGTIEVNDVEGTATGSQIAGMEGLNVIRIFDSRLASAVTGKTASDPVADGVIIYQSTSGDADTSSAQRALFQAVDSTLSSEIESGAMFYLTNTSADVVLDGTQLDFDSSAANLLTAAGNDANNWGTAGENGADVTLTGIGQTLDGAIEADTISSVEVFLAEGSVWTGAASIVENAEGTTEDEPLKVNIEGTSTWTVSQSCTVSDLTCAPGAKVVDEQGKSVSVVAAGQTVVQGDGDVVVTVTGSYEESDDACADAVAASDPTVGRAGYDECFGTSTSFDSAAAAASAVDEASAAAQSASGSDAGDDAGAADDGEATGNWLLDLWNSFLSLFGR